VHRSDANGTPSPQVISGAAVSYQRRILAAWIEKNTQGVLRGTVHLSVAGAAKLAPALKALLAEGQ